MIHAKVQSAMAPSSWSRCRTLVTLAPDAQVQGGFSRRATKLVMDKMQVLTGASLRRSKLLRNLWKGWGQPPRQLPRKWHNMRQSQNSTQRSQRNALVPTKHWCRMAVEHAPCLERLILQASTKQQNRTRKKNLRDVSTTTQLDQVASLSGPLLHPYGSRDMALRVVPLPIMRSQE